MTTADLLAEHPHLVTRVCLDQPFTSAVAYLATPYTLYGDRDEAARSASYYQGLLAEHGIPSISPIVMGHRMFQCQHWTHDQWMAWCIPILSKCGCVVIPPMRGWDTSRGVHHELKYALGRGLPVYLG